MGVHLDNTLLVQLYIHTTVYIPYVNVYIHSLFTILVFFFSNMSIVKIHAREIFDSRGNPTVEVDLYTEKGASSSLFSYVCIAFQCYV